MKYRSDDEVDLRSQRDTITALERVMVADGVADEADIEAVRTAVQAEVEAAIQFAEASPLPDPGELLDNVCTETLPMSGRQLTYLKAFNEGLRQVMEADPDVFVAGEDVGPDRRRA